MTLPAAVPAKGVAASPALVAGLRVGYWRNIEGTVEELPLAAAAERARRSPPLLCHLPATARRLGLGRFAAFDLLELFAFVHPGRFCLPTVRGLAEALGLPPFDDPAEGPRVLADAAARLLGDLAEAGRRGDPSAPGVARAMAAGGWAWGPAVLDALGLGEVPAGAGAMAGLEVWRRLPEWAERAPEPPPGDIPVTQAEARGRLAELLGSNAEARPQQADYASALAPAFQPREMAGAPHVVLAEAGTGVGKTLGYVAPASVWAQKNRGAVWISTFTRNLQHQIDQELDRLYPDPAEKARKVVVRKGRENYLCLLNLEEAAGAARLRSQDAVGLGLVARWVARTRDGALIGSDLPGWLVDLAGRNLVYGLADQRGECVYSACPHYQKCFIEHGVRRARRAEIVVANHALVMIQAALGGDERLLPTRYVFDEGHHVFGAADSAFSGQVSGRETYDLRRWLRGAERPAEGRARGSRARGLQARAGDLLANDNDGAAALAEAMKAGLALPAEGWPQRLAGGQPAGPVERFLALVRQQVYARAQGADNPYGIECATLPPVDGLIDAAAAVDEALDRLARPLARVAERLALLLDDEAAELDTPTRLRIDSLARGIRRRVDTQIVGWRHMVQALRAGQTPPEFVDWFAVEREFGRDADIGMHRHWIDPTVPFAEFVAAPAHGVVITSATLRDGSGDVEVDWRAAEARTGANHLPTPAIRAAVQSPFDYANQTRVLIVTDVRKDDMAQVAAAYRELFLAAKGGGLGLFTAISRLRAVHERIAGPLEEAGLPLLAQHIDGLDPSTLIDIFRAERDSCLLGTDAVRDGVDVPGASLRLIVFDRVPWPRPDILHRARRDAFGGRAYDDMIARLRLKQAFGRLIRRADDRGVFVMLDPMLPSRLLGAIPEGVEVRRIGLAEAVAVTREFLSTGA
ncbi:MAG TPA: ATP-dependent DNA helicase [Alphaproteobacteria bacterium]|nr:ATP-dependent DNA helicase [Alphaproteobacteria bacterium]